MTQIPSFQLPSNVNKEIKMANRFLGLRSKKMVPFIDGEIEINKLSINQVRRIQAVTAAAANMPEEDGQISIIRSVIEEGAPEMRGISKEEFEDFAIDDLSKLSNDILEFSGLVGKELPK